MSERRRVADVTLDDDGIVWRVASDTDVTTLQVATRGLCERLGFGGRERWEVAIAVTELATNIVKFAGAGTIALRWREASRALEVEASDRGPGIADPDVALRDHVTEGADARVDPATRRGLGIGLGAVKRLLDELTIEVREGGGARLVGVKYLRDESEMGWKPAFR